MYVKIQKCSGYYTPDPLLKGGETPWEGRWGWVGGGKGWKGVEGREEEGRVRAVAPPRQNLATTLIPAKNCSLLWQSRATKARRRPPGITVCNFERRHRRQQVDSGIVARQVERSAWASVVYTLLAPSVYLASAASNMHGAHFRPTSNAYSRTVALLPPCPPGQGWQPVRKIWHLLHLHRHSYIVSWMTSAARFRHPVADPGFVDGGTNIF